MAEMSPLRRRMIEDMTVRNLSPATQRSYVHAVSKFSRYFGCSPDRLGLEDVRAFQVHLVANGISWPALNEIRWVKPSIATVSPSPTLAAIASCIVATLETLIGCSSSAHRAPATSATAAPARSLPVTDTPLTRGSAIMSAIWLLVANTLM